MNFISKNWPTVAIFFAGISGTIATYVATNRNDIQQESIQKTGEANKELGKNIQELAFQIKSLQDINNIITQSTSNIVSENKIISEQNLKLSEQIKNLQNANNDLTKSTNSIVDETKLTTKQNLQLTEKSEALIYNVENLTNKVSELLIQFRNEATGGTSIPIISGNLSLTKSSPQSNRGRRKENYDTTLDKWVLRFHLNNIDSFSITKIQIIRDRHQERMIIEENANLPTIEILRPGDNYLLEPIYFLKDFESHDSFKVFTFRIKWKVEYVYRAWVVGNTPNGTLMQSYTYNNNNYKNVNDMIIQIKNDLSK